MRRKFASPRIVFFMTTENRSECDRLTIVSCCAVGSAVRVTLCNNSNLYSLLEDSNIQEKRRMQQKRRRNYTQAYTTWYTARYDTMQKEKNVSKFFNGNYP